MSPSPEVRVFSSPNASLRVTRLAEDFVSVEWQGVFDDEALPIIDQYLKFVGEVTEAANDRVHQLHDMVELRRYTKNVILRHVEFSRRHDTKIGRIAAVSNRALIYLAVATVAAWQRRPVKSFDQHDLALRWLRAAA